jgi:hypothetical protein
MDYSGPEKREALRRMEDRHCAAHENAMAEINKRVPIWVFLAALGIVSSVFTYLNLNQKEAFQQTQVVIKELTKSTSDEVKALGLSVNTMQRSQDVMLYRLDEIGKKIQNGHGDKK